MNLEKLKRNTGWQGQMIPIASRLDDKRRELPPVDDDWIIEEVSNAGVRIFNTRTQHHITLGADHIHNFTSNPDRSHNGIKHGFLTLNVQIFLQGTKSWVRPNAGPGKPVKPQIDEIVDKWVDFEYPSDSGIQQRLEAAGYTVKWCSEDKLSRKIDLEGCEVVVGPDAQ